MEQGSIQESWLKTLESSPKLRIDPNVGGAIA